MNRTIGGIPVLYWVLGLGTVVGASYWLKKKQAAGTTATASKTPPFTQAQEVQDFQIFSALTGQQQASDLNFLGTVAGLFGGGGSGASSTTGSGSSGGSGSGSTTPATTTTTPGATPATSAIPSPAATGIVPGGSTPPNTGGTVIASGPPPGSVTAQNNANAESNYLSSVGNSAASLYQSYIATLPAGGQSPGTPLSAQSQAALNAYNAAVAAN